MKITPRGRRDCSFNLAAIKSPPTMKQVEKVNKQVPAGVAPCNFFSFVKLFRTSVARQVPRRTASFLLLQRLATVAVVKKQEFHRVTLLCETVLVRHCTQVSAKSFNV